MLDLQELHLAVNDTFKVLPAPGLLLLSNDGTQKNFITIGWLQFGNLWGKWTVNIFIRLSRYSFKILNNSEYFSLNVLDPQKYINQINLCAQTSGRNHDKIKETGLTTTENSETKIISIAEAQTVFECKILNKVMLDKANLSDELYEKFYSNEDFHQLITAEILNIRR
ncbi:MAG: flavin reductase [Spirochaetales bacterium]|nr:flavin reductase [Spirochaetales bacterium]